MKILKTEELTKETLSLDEISEIYRRFASNGRDLSKIELDYEQLVFHVLSQLSEEDLQKVRNNFIKKSGVFPEKLVFPQHRSEKLDPKSLIHPTNKVQRF